QQALGRTQEAITALQHNLDIVQNLADSSPDSAFAKRDLAYANSQLGQLHRATGHTDQALAFLRKDVEITTALAQADAQDANLQIDLASGHSEVAIAHQDLASDAARPRDER